MMSSLPFEQTPTPIRNHDLFASNRAYAPIGVFDSGVGGLSIVQEIQALLPHESIYYLADTANVPYGGRSDSEIQQLTANAVAWLFDYGCKAVVVACNTASAFSLTLLRQKYHHNLPIIGLVPALKPAVLHSKSKVVGVLATPGTLRGHLLQDVIRDIAIPAQVTVKTAVSPDLVPLVEAGQFDSVECMQVLQQVLQPLVDAGADYLVLGCTHYPFLKQTIDAVFPHVFHLVDSGMAVAKQTKHILEKHTLLTPHTQTGTLSLYATGNLTSTTKVIARLLDKEVQVQAAF